MTKNIGFLRLPLVTLLFRVYLGGIKGGSSAQWEFVWKTGREKLFVHHGLHSVQIFAFQVSDGEFKQWVSRENETRKLWASFPGACVPVSRSTGRLDSPIFPTNWERGQREISRQSNCFQCLIQSVRTTGYFYLKLETMNHTCPETGTALYVN